MSTPWRDMFISGDSIAQLGLNGYRPRVKNFAKNICFGLGEVRIYDLDIALE